MVRCLTTSDFIPPGKPSKPVVHIDDVIESDVQIISVLKGNTKIGLAKMTSRYRPSQGEELLLFANYLTSGTNAWYVATEGYRVIPLNHDFNINELDGKTLDEQIQLIFKSRLKDLDNEIARDKEEKARLEQGIINNVLTNAPAEH